MKVHPLIIGSVLTACVEIRAQVAPATTSSAELVYDLRYSQTVETYNEHRLRVERNVASGEIEYLNGNEHTPFRVTYSGGDIWAVGDSNSVSGTAVFQHCLLSQGYVARQWAWNLSNDVSYLPQSPTTGFSGIPGVGSLPGEPVTSDQSILLDNTRRVHSGTELSFTHSLGSDKTIALMGGYDILRFPDGHDLETNQLQVAPQLRWRLTALNSLSMDYTFSRFSYPGSSFIMRTQSAQFGLKRIWNRRLKVAGSAGPEWITSTDDRIVPSSTPFGANAALQYQGRAFTSNVSYSRETTGGAGTATQLGAHRDDVSIGIARASGRNLSVSASGSYQRTRGLSQSGTTNSAFGGVQAQRRIGQYLTLFVDYTLIEQRSSLALRSHAINGWSQVLGFGIGYFPRSTRIAKR